MFCSTWLQAFEIADALAPAQFYTTPDSLATHPTPEAIFLQGLAQQYPKQVIAELPAAPSHAKIAPVIEKLSRDIVYIRIYDFATDLSDSLAYLTNPALILDLRYVFSAETVEYIAALHALDRDYPIMVLLNNKTSGPWEVQLADLQAENKITTIGTATAGNTGIYEKFWDTPTYYKLVAQKLPQNGQSILQTGLIPNISIDVRTDDDYQSYYAINKGYKVTDMIRFSYGDDQQAAPEQHTSGEALLNDKILQRAVDVIVALQILGDLPF